MSGFKEEYARLNEAQRAAVDHIDGPILVIAGPGTGKTQLLSARVANILQKTDSLPQNILCLTFTESGAANMRERLTRFIGQAAYDVTISTYHAFGGDLISRFPEYFAETRMQNPVDELGKHQLLQNIVEGLSYTNPLKQVQHHLGDLISTISEVKRALLTAVDLRALADENAVFITRGSEQTTRIFETFTTMPRKLEIAAAFFEQTKEQLQLLIPDHAAIAPFEPLARVAYDELEIALQQAEEQHKTTPLTKWKNTWLAKNESGQFIIAGDLQNRRITALADVFEKYQVALETHGWYDFDDMIIRAVAALETHADLRFTLQEQYLYILLDEFQDTNHSQLRLIELLTDNPVHEGRPNVMAVGDDDQAIYAFQGAQYSNMLDFYKTYRDVTVINLTENYRSHHDVLATAHNVAEQISARLHHNFEDMSKTLESARSDLPDPHIARFEFLSNIAEYSWIAHRVAKLIKEGVQPHEIAVLAPGHKYLTALVPYLNAEEIPVRYEKRENILEAPTVKQLVSMSKLILALAANNQQLANTLWPEILSFDFWQIPISEIWKMSWKISDNSEHPTWSQAMLDEPLFRGPGLFFLSLAAKADIESCEVMLDYLIGTETLETNEPELKHIQSPFRGFYTNADAQVQYPERFYETLSHLTVLRAKLREYQATQEASLRLRDLINYIALYEDAGERIINTSPYNQQANAVQLMTVFKAKGLEFEHVFLPSFQDEVWGNAAQGNRNKLTLPPNLAPIRHAGTTEDEKLRLLFVAITRAKFGLYLTSATQNYAGKATKRLKYIDEQEQPDGTVKAMVLPEKYQLIQVTDHEAPTLAQLELDWHERHTNSKAIAELQSLLRERITTYQLSPTHLNAFIDVEYGGPEQFFFNTILRFPQAPSINSQFGNAIHETLEWIQHRVDDESVIPVIQDITAYFTTRIRSKKLSEPQTELEIERGEKALSAYIAKKGSIFKPGDKAERNFRNEGVFIGDAHLSGKIDRMEIDKEAKTITVVDYKTGKSYGKWESTTKLHKYRQQLYCYKMLIEGSHTFKGYTVTAGRLEFIEPDQEHHINALEINFNDTELARIKQLLEKMWQHVTQLTFPDISNYDQTLSGMKQFEDDLLDDKI